MRDGTTEVFTVDSPDDVRAQIVVLDVGVGVGEHPIEDGEDGVVPDRRIVEVVLLEARLERRRVDATVDEIVEEAQLRR